MSTLCILGKHNSFQRWNSKDNNYRHQCIWLLSNRRSSAMLQRLFSLLGFKAGTRNVVRKTTAVQCMSCEYSASCLGYWDRTSLRPCGPCLICEMGYRAFLWPEPVRRPAGVKRIICWKWMKHFDMMYSFSDHCWQNFPREMSMLQYLKATVLDKWDCTVGFGQQLLTMSIYLQSPSSEVDLLVRSEKVTEVWGVYPDPDDLSRSWTGLAVL